MYEVFKWLTLIIAALGASTLAGITGFGLWNGEAAVDRGLNQARFHCVGRHWNGGVPFRCRDRAQNHIGEAGRRICVTAGNESRNSSESLGLLAARLGRDRQRKGRLARRASSVDPIQALRVE